MKSGIGTVVLIGFRFDGDDLQARASARLEALAQFGEIGRPVFFTHSLEHLDGDDRIILPGLVTVILEPQVDLVAEAGVLDPVAGEGQLFVGNRQPGDPASDLARREFGKTAPAAADLQNMITGLMPMASASARYFAVCALGRSLAPSA
jgi:hypothetical protein